MAFIFFFFVIIIDRHSICNGLIIEKPDQVADIYYALCPSASSLNLAIERAYESNFHRIISVAARMAINRFVEIDDAERRLTLDVRVTFDWLLPCREGPELCNQLVIVDNNRTLTCKEVRSNNNEDVVAFSFPQLKRNMWHPRFDNLLASHQSADITNLMSEHIRIFPFVSKAQWSGRGPLDAACVARDFYLFPFDSLNCTVVLEPSDSPKIVSYPIAKFTARRDADEGMEKWRFLGNFSLLASVNPIDSRISFETRFVRRNGFRLFCHAILPGLVMLCVLQLGSLALSPTTPCRCIFSLLVVILKVALLAFAYSTIPRRNKSGLLSQQPVYVLYLIGFKTMGGAVMTGYSLLAYLAVQLPCSTRPICDLFPLTAIRFCDFVVAVFSIALSLFIDAVYFDLLGQCFIIIDN